MQVKVSEVIVKFMECLGIDTIFGIPGAHILPVYDSLYDSGIQSVLAKHEQGAAFMACGYANASGGIAACIATAGPGATNLVTGIANAYVDKQPILIITGETSTHIFGKGGLQESTGEGGSIDQCAIFDSITRYSKLVERTDYLPQVLKQAARILRSPNTGPVLLSFPFNIQKELIDDDFLQDLAVNRTIERGDRQRQPAMELSRLITEAKHPVIVAGYGCIRSGAQEIIDRLSSMLRIPVTTSLKGKGIIDEQSELSIGSLGVTSDGMAYRYIAEQADLIIFLGAGFNERTSYLWDKRLLEGKTVAQVDYDNEQLEKVFTADLAIHGDIREVVEDVVEDLEIRGAIHKEFSREAVPQPTQADGTDSSFPSLSLLEFSLVERFFTELEKQFPEDAYVFDDNIIFAQNFLNVSSRSRYFPNSGVSSLGHAIPAAIGARFFADKPTFAILGDGGFQMCCMEIMTAVNYRLPINVVLFNNATMGLIRKNQHQQYNERFIDCDFVNPDFADLARSFGINHKRIETEADLQHLFSQMDLTGATNLIEIIIDKDAFPSYQSGR
jgi:acetolactate synthase-1/2/3 large subunit